jgi:hypothetical protein
MKDQYVIAYAQNPTYFCKIHKNTDFIFTQNQDEAFTTTSEEEARDIVKELYKNRSDIELTIIKKQPISKDIVAQLDSIFDIRTKFYKKIKEVLESFENLQPVIKVEKDQIILKFQDNFIFINLHLDENIIASDPQAFYHTDLAGQEAGCYVGLETAIQFIKDNLFVHDTNI